jgi:hypothetical protein
MNKKGVELSMNVIIIAAIGVLVLIILAVLVINASSRTQNAQTNCNLMGGICKMPSACGMQDRLTGTGCSGTLSQCCRAFNATG